MNGAFALPARKFFVVHGSIAEGVVRKGMLMRVLVNPSVSITLSIEAVEFLDSFSGTSEVALCAVYKDDDELGFLKAISVGGEEIEILNPPASGG